MITRGAVDGSGGGGGEQESEVGDRRRRVRLAPLRHLAHAPGEIEEHRAGRAKLLVAPEHRPLSVLGEEPFRPRRLERRQERAVRGVDGGARVARLLTARGGVERARVKQRLRVARGVVDAEAVRPRPRDRVAEPLLRTGHPLHQLDGLAALDLVEADRALVRVTVLVELERPDRGRRGGALGDGALDGALPSGSNLDGGLIVVDRRSGSAGLAVGSPEGWLWNSTIAAADAERLSSRIRNAGAIFLGPHTPEAIGDYVGGSNHVLPTGGCACHSSGLSVRAFLKAVHVVDYTREALAEVAGHVVTLAEAEDLPGHGAAVRVRFAPTETTD